MENCIHAVMQAANYKLTQEEAREMVANLRELWEDLPLQDRLRESRALIQELRRARPEREVAIVRRWLNEARHVEVVAQDGEVLLNMLAEAPDKSRYQVAREFLRDKIAQANSLRKEALFVVKKNLLWGEHAATHAAILKDKEAFGTELVKFIDGVHDNPFTKGLRETVTELVKLANHNGSSLLNRPHALISMRWYDPVKLRGVGKQRFVSDHLRLSHGDFKKMAVDMSVKRTKGETLKDAVIRQLENTYDRLTDGNGLVRDGAILEENSILGLLNQDPNTPLAKTESAFHIPWRDGKAFMELYNLYGSGDVRLSFALELDRFGQYLANTELFGPYPNQWFEVLFYSERGEGLLMRGASPEDKALMRRHWTGQGIKGVPKALHNIAFNPSLKSIFDHITGTANIADDVAMAETVGFAQKFVSASLLQESVLSQLPDTAIYHATMHRLGGPVQSFLDSTVGWIREIKPGKDRELAMDMMSAGITGFSRSLQEHLISGLQRYPDMNGARRHAAWLDLWFDLNGMRVWEHAHKRAASLTISRFLAHTIENGFDKLDEGTRAYVQEMGLTPDLLEAAKSAVRKVPELGMRDDATFLMLSDISDRELRVKLRAFMDRVISLSTPTPDAEQLATISWGFRPGTVAGSGLRILGQFKTFPLIVAQRVWPLVRKYEGKRGLLAMGTVMTLMGLMKEELKALLHGESLRHLDDVDTWKRALKSGGFLHAYGDWALTYRPFSASGLLANPLQDQAQDVTDLVAKWIGSVFPEEGKERDLPLQETAELLRSHTPFMGLPLVRGAADRLFFYGLYEALDPGWIDRYQQRLEDQNRTLL